MIRVAICDDDEMCLKIEEKAVKEVLDEIKIDAVIDRYTSNVELLHDTERLIKYDIFFMDIDMKDIDGIEAGMKIREVSKTCFIIYISGYVQYSPDCFRVNAFRFIVKNSGVLKEYIKEALNSVIKEMENRSGRIIIKDKNSHISVSCIELLYIESKLHRIEYHIMENDTEKIISTYGKLDDIEQEINRLELCRVQKSFIVNFRYVEKIKGYNLTLNNGMVISISRSHAAEVKEKYNKYKRIM